jgi:5-methyltetrahydrofolate--homocysteine methyltransferase
MSEQYAKMVDCLVSGDNEEVKGHVQGALDGGAEAQEILDKGLLAGMDIVGKRFKACEMFIPEVIASAQAMKEAMDILRPCLSESQASALGTVVIGTVEGDLHDIGKNLVAMMLEGAGFKVVDLGIDVKAQVFVDAAKEHKPDILGMSALLSTTAIKMGETINALKEAGIREQIKIMAGGQAVTQAFVDEIEGDAYGFNAGLAVEKARELIGR